MKPSKALTYRITATNAKNADRLKKAAELIGNLGNGIQYEGAVLSHEDLSNFESLIDKYVIGLLKLKQVITSDLKENEIESGKEEDLSKDIEGDVF